MIHYLRSMLLVILITFSDQSIAALGQGLWPNCIPTSVFTVPSEGGTFQAFGCISATNAFLTVDMSGISRNSSATVLIQGGSIGMGVSGGLCISGPTSTVSSTKGPIYVTVRDVQFKAVAILRFKGALSPNSTLAFINNSFYLTNSNANSGVTLGTSPIVSGIFIGGDTDGALVLTNSSLILVANNTVQAEKIAYSSSLVSAVFIGFIAATIANSSRFVVFGNTMANTTLDCEAHVLLWHHIPLSITIASNSSFNITGNTMSSSSINGASSAVKLYSSLGLFTMALAQYSTLTITGNGLQNCTGNSLLTLVSFIGNLGLPMSLINNSKIVIGFNFVDNLTSVQTSGQVYAVYFRSPMQISLSLNHSSEVSIEGNYLARLRAIGSTALAIAVVSIEANTFFDIDVRDFSVFHIDRNGITDSAGTGPIRTVRFSILPQISVANTGAITFNENYIQNCVGRYAYVFDSTGLKATLTNNSRLMCDGNTINQTSLSSINDIVAVSIPMDVILSVALNSTASFNRNSVISSTATNGRAYGLQWLTSSNVVISVATGSKFTVDRNAVVSTQASGLYAVKWSFQGALDISTSGKGSSATLSGNTVRNGVANTDSTVAFFITTNAGSTSISANNSSFLRIGNNTVSNTTSKGNIFAFRCETITLLKIVAGNGSIVAVVGNGVSGSTSTVNINAVGWSFTPVFNSGSLTITSENSSAILMSYNSVAGSNATSGYLGALTFVTSCILVTVTTNDNSTVSLSGNGVNGCAATALIYAFYMNANAIATDLSLFTSGGSQVLMTENYILDSSTFDTVCAVQLFFGSIITIQVANSSSLLVTGNTIRNSSALLNAYLFYVVGNPVDIQVRRSSSVAWDDNSLILSTGVTRAAIVNLPLTATITLGSNSGISVCKNTVVASMSSVVPAINVPRIVMVGSNGNLLISDNSISINGTSSVSCPAVAISVPSVIVNTSVSDSGDWGLIRLEDNTIVLRTVEASSTSLFCPILSLGQVNAIVSITRNTLVSTFVSFISLSSVTVPSIIIDVDEEGVGLAMAENTIRFEGINSIVAGFCLVNVSGALVLSNKSTLSLERNFVSSGSLPSSSNDFSYNLLNVTNFRNMSAAVTVNACGNQLFGKSIWIPADRMSSVLAPFISKCETQTPSLSSTLQLEITKSQLSSATTSQTITSSVSASNSSWASKTASLSDSIFESQTSTKKLSPSTTRESSQSTTFSESTSPSDTSSYSVEPLLTSSRTITMSNSDSFSGTQTCKALEGVNATDTCSFLRPLPLSTVVASDSHFHMPTFWLTGSYDCTQFAIPFETWGGKYGNTHSLTIVGVDQRVPLKGDVQLPPMGDSIEVKSVNVSLVPILLPDSNASSSIFYAADIQIAYIGKTTLNSFRYRLDCKVLPRCPVVMPGEFYITLLASERLMPVPVADAAAVGGKIVSAFGSLKVSPTAVAQLGVVTSLQLMSRCSSIKLDDPDDDDSYSSYASGGQNPLKIAIGAAGGGRRFIRGAALTSALYFVLLSILMFAYTTATARVAHWLNPATLLPTRPTTLLAGYPSALVAVASFAVDGLASTGTILALQGDGWADRFGGVLAVGLCIAFVAHIFFVTNSYRFPKSLVAKSEASARQKLIPDGTLLNAPAADELLPQQELVRMERSSSERGVGGNILEWLGRPTHKWKDRGGGEKWMARYESYIADSHVPWYCGIEQGVALAVCILSSISFSVTSACVVRGVLGVIAIGAQAAVMLVLRPLVHRWRWLLMSTVLLLQTLTAVLSTANAPLQSLHIELGMDSLGVAIFLLLGMATVADMVMLFLELFQAVKMALQRARYKNESLSNSFISMSDFRQLPSSGEESPNPQSPTLSNSNRSHTAPQLVQASDEETDEATIVRGILQSFSQFERNRQQERSGNASFNFSFNSEMFSRTATDTELTAID